MSYNKFCNKDSDIEHLEIVGFNNFYSNKKHFKPLEILKLTSYNY